MLCKSDKPSIIIIIITHKKQEQVWTLSTVWYQVRYCTEKVMMKWSEGLPSAGFNCMDKEPSPVAHYLALCASVRSFLGPCKGYKCVLGGSDPAASTLVGSTLALLLAVDADPTASSLLLDVLDAQVECGPG